MASVREIQLALKKNNCDPETTDGVMGRKTIAAIKKFQKENGLIIDGIVGPKTLAVLIPNARQGGVEIVPVEMPWLLEAYNLIGTQEEPGAGSNEAIVGWGRTVRINYSDDEIPWCGLFVAHCIGSQLLQEPLPINPLGARNWHEFGQSCMLPQLGSIMVFWRGSPDGWKGHVGFYWAEDDTCYHILGGNQSNCVSIVRLKKERLICARWPVNALLPNYGPRYTTKDGMLISENEA